MTTENFDSKKLKQVYELEVEVFSPTQAGSGAKLLPEINYYEAGNSIHVVNIDSLLADEALAGRAFSTGGKFRLSALSQDPAFRRHIAYSTPGRANNQEIVGHVRDGLGRAYVPGSSLKGALRTILGWNFYAARASDKTLAQKLNLKDPELKDPGKLKRNSERADDNLEAEFFVAAQVEPRKRPNYDLMKTMQVSDLYPKEGSRPPQLEDVQIFVRSRDGRLNPKNRPIVAEMLREKTRLGGQLTLDTFALNTPKLNFRERGKSLRELATQARQRVKSLISTELDFYESCERDDSSDNLFDWYNNLYDKLESLTEHEFLLPMGWSTGWNAKTYGENLQERPDFSLPLNSSDPGLRQAFRLGHWEDAGSPFPISRKLIVNRDRAAVLPPGWLLVRLHERAR